MLYKKHHSFCVLLLMCSVIYGCNSNPKEESLARFFGDRTNITSYSEASEPSATIHFTKESSFGNLGKVFFKSISNIALDEYGRVYIENNATIYQYDNNGNYIRSIGRKGRGPGEFQVIHNYKIRNNKLYVYDANLLRISVFNLNTLELEKEIGIPATKGLTGLGEFAVKKDGSLILGLNESKKKASSSITEKYMHYYFMDSTGEINKSEFITTKLADYFEVKNGNGTSYPPIPFDRTTLFSMSGSDRIYFIWTGEIAIKVFNSNGSFLRGFHYPFKNAEINGDSDYPKVYELLNIISDTKRVLGKRIPDTHPAIAHFFIDDEERIWLSTIVSNKNIYEW